MWRGAALADVAGEPFAAAEIRRLEELWLTSGRAGRRRLTWRRGAMRRCSPSSSALIEEHPLRERLHAQRMLALYRSGRQAEALAAYRRSAPTAGRRRSGSSPVAELRELHERILRQDPSLQLAHTVVETGRAADRRAPAGRSDSRTGPARVPPPRATDRRTRALRVAVAVAARHPRRGRRGRHRPPDRRRAAAGDRREPRRRDRRWHGCGHGAVRGRSRPQRAGGGRQAPCGWPTRKTRRFRGSTSSMAERVRIPVGEAPAGLAFAARVAVGHRRSWRDGVADRPGGEPARARGSRSATVRAAIAAGFGALWVASEADRTRRPRSISPAERANRRSTSARTPRRWPPAPAQCG